MSFFDCMNELEKRKKRKTQKKKVGKEELHNCYYRGAVVQEEKM